MDYTLYKVGFPGGAWRRHKNHRFDPLEKEAVTHSSVLAWRIPWTGVWWITVHRVSKSWTQLR